MRDELMDAVRRVAEMDDLDEQTRAIGDLMRDIQAAEPAASALRVEIVHRQRAQGRTYKEIGELLGIHWANVAQIINGRPPTRRRASASGPPPGDVDEA